MNPYVDKAPNGKVYIYTIVDPVTNEIRYIGKTIQSINKRFSTHLNINRNVKNHTKSWITSLINNGVIPKIELLDIVDEKSWENEEKFYISYFRYLGFNLTNHSEGGDKTNLGCRWKLSKETKDKMQLSKRAKNHNLVLLNIYSNEKLKFKNHIEISEHLGVPIEKIHSSSSKKALINKTYIVLKQNEKYDIRNKIGVKKVEATNLESGEVYKADNVKLLSTILNINNSTLCKAIRKNRVVYKKYKVNYVLS